MYQNQYINGLVILRTRPNENNVSNHLLCILQIGHPFYPPILVVIIEGHFVILISYLECPWLMSHYIVVVNLAPSRPGNGL